MKHILLILVSVAVAALGVTVIVANAKGITTPQLLAGIGCVAFSLVLAIPAHFKDAVGALASAAKQLKAATEGNITP